MSTTACSEAKANGKCSKGKDCQECNQPIPNEVPKEDDIQLNVNAKNYIPKKKKENQAPQYNLQAKEYVPKAQQQKNDEEEEEEEDIDEEEMDMIMKDVIDNDVMAELGDDESDDEKWFPKYKDCECCKGLVYKCKGATCESLGQCYCKMKDECEDFDEDK